MPTRLIGLSAILVLISSAAQAYEVREITRNQIKIYEGSDQIANLENYFSEWTVYCSIGSRDGSGSSDRKAKTRDVAINMALQSCKTK